MSTKATPATPIPATRLNHVVNLILGEIEIVGIKIPDDVQHLWEVRFTHTPIELNLPQQSSPALVITPTELGAILALAVGLHNPASLESDLTDYLPANLLTNKAIWNPFT